LVSKQRAFFSAAAAEIRPAPLLFFSARFNALAATACAARRAASVSAAAGASALVAGGMASTVAISRRSFFAADATELFPTPLLFLSERFAALAAAAFAAFDIGCTSIRKNKYSKATFPLWCVTQ